MELDPADLQGVAVGSLGHILKKTFKELYVVQSPREEQEGDEDPVADQKVVDPVEVGSKDDGVDVENVTGDNVDEEVNTSVPDEEGEGQQDKDGVANGEDVVVDAVNDNDGTTTKPDVAGNDEDDGNDIVDDSIVDSPKIDVEGMAELKRIDDKLKKTA